MTGNKDYEFGDGTKALASSTSDAAEAAAAAILDAGGTAAEAGAAARKVLDDSGYQFGDITKGVVKGFEATVREATGNDECARYNSNLAVSAASSLNRGALVRSVIASGFRTQISSATSRKASQRGYLALLRRVQQLPRRRWMTLDHHWLIPVKTRAFSFHSPTVVQTMLDCNAGLRS